MEQLRNFMSETTKATREQLSSLKVIAANMEDAKGLTARIVNASELQQGVNSSIVEIMGEIIAVGETAVGEVTDAAESMQDIFTDVEALRREMKGFTLNS